MRALGELLGIGDGLYLTDKTSPSTFPPSLMKKYTTRDISLGICPTVSGFSLETCLQTIEQQYRSIDLEIGETSCITETISPTFGDQTVWL